MNQEESNFLGDQPGIFSQGSCYITWIAQQYGLSLAPGYSTGECCWFNLFSPIVIIVV